MIDQNALPADFPEALAAAAETVHAVLGAIHHRVSRGNGQPPTLYRIGLAVKLYPDVRHVELANSLEVWATEPERLRRGRFDLATTFRTFCENARAGGPNDDGSPPRPGGPPPRRPDMTYGGSAARFAAVPIRGAR